MTRQLEEGELVELDSYEAMPMTKLTQDQVDALTDAIKSIEKIRGDKKVELHHLQRVLTAYEGVTNPRSQYESKRRFKELSKNLDKAIGYIRSMDEWERLVLQRDLDRVSRSVPQFEPDIFLASLEMLNNEFKREVLQYGRKGGKYKDFRTRWIIEMSIILCNSLQPVKRPDFASPEFADFVFYLYTAAGSESPEKGLTNRIERVVNDFMP